MIIKVSDTLQYEVTSASYVNNGVEMVLTDGRVLFLGGDLSAMEVIDGEITGADAAESISVYDEMDAAYQVGEQEGYAEGVNGAYDE